MSSSLWGALLSKLCVSSSNSRDVIMFRREKVPSVLFIETN